MLGPVNSEWKLPDSMYVEITITLNAPPVHLIWLSPPHFRQVLQRECLNFDGITSYTVRETSGFF